MASKSQTCLGRRTPKTFPLTADLILKKTEWAASSWEADPGPLGRGRGGALETHALGIVSPLRPQLLHVLPFS